MSEIIKCPKCAQVGGTWTRRRLHDGERAIECPSCGTVLTEDYLRDVQGVSDPIIPSAKWDACALPDGFTAADGVALMALESGFSLEPWQFDAIAKFYPRP